MKGLVGFYLLINFSIFLNNEILLVIVNFWFVFIFLIKESKLGVVY